MDPVPKVKKTMGTLIFLVNSKALHQKHLCIFVLKEDHWQNPENFFFRGGHFWRAKSKKCKKKISKNFIVPNCSLGHTNHLYTYKGHIEHVGFT